MGRSVVTGVRHSGGCARLLAALVAMAGPPGAACSSYRPGIASCSIACANDFDCPQTFRCSLTQHLCEAEGEPCGDGGMNVTAGQGGNAGSGGGAGGGGGGSGCQCVQTSAA